MKAKEIRIVRKTVRALSITERRQLEHLTLPSGSFMRTVLHDNPEPALCWLAESKGHILGWSLIRWFPPDIFGRTGSYISVFVDNIYRGHGVGKLLVEEAVGYARERRMRPKFYGASQEQVGFYRSCHVPPPHIISQPFYRRLP